MDFRDYVKNVLFYQFGYQEYKTSVKKSPINENCIVRFYNDILILSEDGLYGIEISSNVLTDERLIKPRDGFIKKDLILLLEQNGDFLIKKLCQD